MDSSQRRESTREFLYSLRLCQKESRTFCLCFDICSSAGYLGAFMHWGWDYQEAGPGGGGLEEEEERKQEMGVVVGTCVWVPLCLRQRERTRARIEFSQQGHWPQGFILLLEG